ncbi:MAG: hypothetical protein ACYCW6_22575 [Candidatus Xenobia bacterium]
MWKKRRREKNLRPPNSCKLRRAFVEAPSVGTNLGKVTFSDRRAIPPLKNARLMEDERGKQYSFSQQSAATSLWSSAATAEPDFDATGPRRHACDTLAVTPSEEEAGPGPPAGMPSVPIAAVPPAVPPTVSPAVADPGLASPLSVPPPTLPKTLFDDKSFPEACARYLMEYIRMVLGVACNVWFAVAVVGGIFGFGAWNLYMLPEADRKSFHAADVVQGVVGIAGSQTWLVLSIALNVVLLVMLFLVVKVLMHRIRVQGKENKRFRSEQDPGRAASSDPATWKIGQQKVS